MNTTTTYEPQIRPRGRHVSSAQPTVVQHHHERHNQRFPDGCGNEHCHWHVGTGRHRAEDVAR